MITFETKNMENPLIKFIKFYRTAEDASQKNIEAACLSTISNDNKPHSRFVNIKYVNDNEFIFFANYNSHKAEDIEYNENVALTFFWNSINTQIRIEGKVCRLNEESSDSHWKTRSDLKNALAISSQQSSLSDSYQNVINNYNIVLKGHDLAIRPSYWGGYIINPIYFEFWEGHDSRLNKREVYKKNGGNWNHFILQP